MHNALSYNSKVNNIATDVNCITPGMIYVDINHKSKADFFEVFRKGASLIVTDRNIFDNSLPIIVVKDIEWAYLRLLNSLHDNILNKINFIAIYGGNQGDLIANILNTLFKKCSFNNSQLTYNAKHFNTQAICNTDIERFFYHIMDCFDSGIKIIPLSMDFDKCSDPMQAFISDNTDCLIIENSTYLDFIMKGSEDVKKPLIINIDKSHNLTIIKDKTEDFVITYGLGKKASVTATSIGYGECTSFNYCLQRSFYSRSKKAIEPFETPLSIRGLGINRVYSALAAISCALYYDMDIKNIKESLMEYSENGRNLLIKRYDKFALIDNFCIDYLGIKETLETVQLLDYQNLYLLVSYNLFSKIQNESVAVGNLLELVVSANVKQIIISDFTDENNNKLNFELVMVKTRQNNIDLKLVGNPANAVTLILNNINKKDALLILGGEEFNATKTIVDLLLTEEIS